MVVVVVDVVVLVVVLFEASEKPPNIFIPVVRVVLQLQTTDWKGHTEFTR